LDRGELCCNLGDVGFQLWLFWRDRWIGSHSLASAHLLRRVGAP
jgi:hypothetical protein